MKFNKSILIFIILLFSLPIAYSFDRTGLIGEWKFEDDAIDSSGFNNNGSVNGSLFNSSAGFNGKGAYIFDGINDYIKINDSPILEPLSFSISFWVKPTKFITNTGMVGKIDTGANDGYLFRVIGTDGTWEMRTGATGVTNRTALTASQRLQLNTWNFVTGVFVPNQSLTIYLNGTQVGTASVNYSMTYDNSNFEIGRYPTLDGQYFNGTIDEILIFNRSLGSSEILQLFGEYNGLIYYNNPTNGTYSTSSANYYNGLTFVTGIDNQTPVSINVSGTDCTSYGIWNFSGAVQPTGTPFIFCTPDANGICTFNTTPHLLKTNKTYFIGTNNFGVSCDIGFENSASYPIVGSSLNFTQTCYDNSGNWGCSSTQKRGWIHNFVTSRLILSDSSNVNISSLSPANNSVNNTQNWNFTFLPVWNGFIISSCGLYINNSLRTLNNSVIINGTTNFLNLSNLSQGYYSSRINCSVTNGSYFATEPINFYFDTAQPIITSSFSGNNVIVVNNNLTGQINFSDIHLWSINISLLNTVLFNLTNISITQYQYNISLNISNYRGGALPISIQSCDGHTGKKISNYDVIIDKNSNVMSVKYTFLNDKSVIIKSKNPIDIEDVDSFKLDDRYNFLFDFKNNPAFEETFIVTSTDRIEIVDYRSDFAGWLIIPSLNKWIDFDLNDNKKYETKIKRIDDLNVEVTIFGLKNKKVRFKSIGDINCNNQTYYILHATTNIIYNASTITGQIENYKLNLTWNQTFGTGLNASILFNNISYFLNGTNYTDHYEFEKILSAPFISNQNQTISFYFNYSYPNNNIYQIDNATQLVYTPDIDNCTKYSTVFHNYSIKDESTEELITSTLRFIYEFSYGTFSSSYNTTMTGASSYKFCLYPSWINLSADITAQYEAIGYEQRDYIKSNQILNNTVQYLNLFLLSTGNSTQIKIHVTDGSDNDLADIVIEAYHYDIGSNTYKIVEIESTDSTGIAQFSLKANTDYYKFKFYQNAIPVLETGRFKITTTPLEYIIRSTQTVSPLAEWLIINNGFLFNLTYSNSTNIVLFSWNDGTPLPQDYCLNITDNNMSYYSACSTSKISSLQYTLSKLNTSYIAIAYTHTSTGLTFILKTLGIDTRTNWRTFGRGFGTSLALIIFLTVSLLGLSFGREFKSSTNVTIFLGVSALIVIYLFGIIPMNKVALTGIVVVAGIILWVINKRQS